MKKFFYLAFLVFAVFLSAGGADAAAPFSGAGSGTDIDPYIITTPGQLDEVRNYLGDAFILSNDIDLTDYLATGGAGYVQWGTAGWEPIGDNTVSFTGSFDGAGFVITGLWIYRPTDEYVGLFGQALNAEIRNLGVEIAPAGVKGKSHVGGLAGVQYNNDPLKSGVIENCHVTGNVSADVSNAGGLVGTQYSDGGSGEIVNCYATGNVESNTNYAGGLVGAQDSSAGGSGEIVNCYATGNVTATNDYAGGLAGYQLSFGAGSRSEIENCYATGDVSARHYAGGLVGEQCGNSAGGGGCEIKNCYATGDVTANSIAGGLAGHQYSRNSRSEILNCYATGNITANGTVGGLVGHQFSEDGDSVIENCYATGNVTATNNTAGGLVGYRESY
ncbi:MAG: hypothetical protein FWG09_00545, partial [Synergistaceae bacterium]|nr:hypothetical protein [Synergistaceae bacterium]